MRLIAVGQVEATRHPDYYPGEFVSGIFGRQDYALVKTMAIHRIQPRLISLASTV